MKYLWFTLLGIVFLSSCSQKKSSGEATMAKAEMTAMPDAEGWVDLFNGKTTKGWRTYRKKTIGKSWVVKDGALTLEVVTDGDETRSEDGGDIITEDQYEDFELSLEWKISPCGNSGILFNVIEGEKYERTYHTGPEMQVLDNDCHPDAKIHTHRSGDLYDLIACSKEVEKPAGEWNLVDIRIKSGHAEFNLNGQKVVEFTMFDQSWEDRIAKSKFKDMPGFGKFRKGHIALQDHGYAVAFRNIKIREL